MSEYQIFCDATADQCPEMMEGLPPVTVIPMDVEIAGKNYTYGPGGNLTAEEFYGFQRQGNYASTTQIPPAAFLPWFEPVLKAGKDLIYFPLTSGLSGTSASAMMCMEDLRKEYPGRTILCVDTFCASVGQGLMVREAARKQAEGLTIQELAAWVEENRLKVGHWFTVDVFDHLKHGGRVSAAVAVVGAALQIKPMLRVDEEGRLQVVDKPRGRRRAMAALLGKMEATWDPRLGRTVLIGHGDDPDSARELEESIRAAYPEAEIYTAPIGPIIGAHTGPGMLALVFWGTQR